MHAEDTDHHNFNQNVIPDTHWFPFGLSSECVSSCGGMRAGARRTRGVTAAGRFHYLQSHRGNPADFKGNEHGP